MSDIKLQLGDLIQISAPNDPNINEDIYYYINYIDENKIRLEEADGSEQILTLTDGYWDNESIEDIFIISHAEEIGYARQNNLINGVWIDIHFNGDLPLTLTGKITNLEHDKIEVTTFPDNDVIFIDFRYKGLPEDLPIEKIQIRKAPDALVGQVREEEPEKAVEELEPKEELEPQEELEPNPLEAMERKYKDIQRQLLTIPEDELLNENLDFEKQKEIQDQTRSYIFNADQIHFGEDLEAITQLIDVPEEEQRYDIDKQLDDLLDDMLSTIPNAQRTDLVKNNIHKMIQRFKELREDFSVFDEKGYALMPKAHGSNYKPIVNVMTNLEKQLYWMLPVVKNIKKLYRDDGEDEDTVELSANDAELNIFHEVVAAEKEIVDRYDKNTMNVEGNKYALLQKELNPYLTPFLDPIETNDILIQQKVNTNITAIVDNLENCNSSVQGSDELSRRIQKKRFALQNYNIGTTGLEITKVRGDNPIIKRKKLTENDSLALKSILTLPEPALRFSRINLNTPTILEKSNLNLQFLNYWQLLKESTRVGKTVINDLNKPYEHQPDTFLKSVRNFKASDLPPNKDNYTKFLDNIIPKTKLLFELIKPNLDGKLSIPDILNYMEPFMIYHADLNLTQYKEMNNFIDEKINEYRKKYASKARDYASLKGSQNVMLPSLLKILDENVSLRTKLLDVYGFTDTIMSMSNADFIKRIYEIDGGVFYNNAIALISTNLMIADGTRDMADIDIYLNKEKQDALSKTAAASKTAASKTAASKPVKSRKNAAAAEGGAGECNKFKVIAKRYIEMDELNEDNGKEAFFDKKYDTTAYDIGEKFKADPLLPTSDQIQHYVDKLIKNKGLNEVSARRDAEAILKGKRIIEPGEYAVLEITDETSATLQYYVRQNENWVLDDTIDSEIMADDMKMFCNLNEKCIAVKDKCEDQTTGANEIKKQNLKLLLAEFNNVLNVNKDIITGKIEDELTSADARIDMLRSLRLMKMYRYEIKNIEIGNTAEEVQKIIISPYDGLLNTILGQTDIAKRYLDIANFVKAFTRTGLPENDESTYWLYCIKSNKKMLPTFIAKLASTFLTGGDFAAMLDKICALQGTLSEDGDKYVDKYSGYTIKMIEMSTDEEYNEEGFKIVTRAVMEGDVGDMLLQSLPAELKVNVAIKRKYATPDATNIYNVLEALSTNMGVNITDQQDNIVRNTLKQLTNTAVIPPKAAYEKSFATMAAKGKHIDTYETVYNSTLLYLTFGYYLIAIQTSVPPIKTKTTFPGCKKSFSGFPIEGSETKNMKGLEYVSCVAFKIKNKAALPWAAIANRSETFIAKQIEATITRYILPTEEVQNDIKQLKLYLSENPEPDIPAEHAIENWANFLPPLKQLKMATTQDLGDIFKSRLSDSLRKGQKTQQDFIVELQSKMILFSFHIIDLIEKTVRGEQAILKGKGGEPYVENACCDTSENNTIQYFVKKQPDIATFNNKVVRLSDLYADTQKLSKAVLLYDPSNTKRKLREIENKFSEQTIYRAFIVYCKFNSLVPLSDSLKAICPTKPENFDSNDSLEESIRKLKSNARNYSEESLQQLLEVINASTKTMIKKVEEKEVSNVSKLTEIMTKMDEEDKRPSNFRTDFLNVLRTFEINALSADTPEMRKLKNLLAILNTDMLKQITEFIRNFGGNVKNADIKNFKTCLETIVDFKETGNDLILGKKEETGYKMINFMKKSLRSLTREFPNIIINEVNYDYAGAPSHWELSAKHENDVFNMIKDHYIEFSQFYKDPQIQLLMKKMIETTSDINDLAQNTLCYAPVELKTKLKSKEQERKEPENVGEKAKEEKYSAFDLDLTALLFKFYFYNVLTDLISLQEDKDLLGLPLKKVEESEEEESFMTKANQMDILAGNQGELAEKIADVIVSFTNFICKDKTVINYNYKMLMDFILRSKEKEKSEITNYLGKMTAEERAIENNLKKNKLKRWSKGAQKGIHTYVGKTYDEEREEMEQIALRDVLLNKESGVTDRTRDIIALGLVEEIAEDAEIEREDNMITDRGENDDPEEFGMDGDENFDY
jgi:hypothetical protein